jgi:U3 small nucleolar RNA-associated protein 14
MTFFVFSSAAIAEDKLIIMGNEESLEIAESWYSFFDDKGVPYIKKDINEFEKYKTASHLFILADLENSILDEIFSNNLEFLKNSRSMKSALYDRFYDKYTEDQFLYIFAGSTAKAALKMSKEKKEEWWPIMADNFDISLIEDEIFAY